MNAEHDNLTRPYTSAEFAYTDALNGVLPVELRDLTSDQEKALRRLIDDMASVIEGRANREEDLVEAKEEIKQLREQINEIIQENKSSENDHIDALRTLAQLHGINANDAKSAAEIINLLNAKIAKLNELVKAIRTIGSFAINKQG